MTCCCYKKVLHSFALNAIAVLLMSLFLFPSFFKWDVWTCHCRKNTGVTINYYHNKTDIVKVKLSQREKKNFNRFSIKSNTLYNLIFSNISLILTYFHQPRCLLGHQRKLSVLPLSLFLVPVISIQREEQVLLKWAEQNGGEVEITASRNGVTFDEVVWGQQWNSKQRSR